MALKNIKKIFEYNGDDQDNLMGTEDSYYTVSESKIIKEASESGNQMILWEPKAFSEAQQIADNLKKRNSVVVNLKRVTTDQAKRIIDFLSGVVYAIGGSMQKIGIGIYLCVPKNVNVQGQITDDTEKSTKSNKDKELDW